MNEGELRASAALQELKAILDILTQRCVNHAGERAMEQQASKALREQNEKQAEELVALKAKQPKPKK